MHSRLLPIHGSDLGTSRAVFVLLLTCSALVATCCTSGRPARDPSQIESLEQRVHRLINQERIERGLSALERLDVLDEEARRHSEAMARGKRFSHRGFDDRVARVRRIAQLATVGENLSQSRGHADPASLAVEQWLGSRGHRRNLHGDFDLTGIGVARARDGTVFITQLFANSVSRRESPQPAPIKR